MSKFDETVEKALATINKMEKMCSDVADIKELLQSVLAEVRRKK